MPEQMAFARKASGLVRGLSFIDAFGVGFMNQGLTPSMWVMISLGLGVYTGGNLIIATLLSVLLCGIGFSLVWGILGGSMPRSGGEYIYNSRIIHPLIGIAESFGNAFVWIMWIFVLAPWTIDPGLVMMFQFLGMPAAAEAISTPIAVFLISSVVSFIALLFVVFGMKVFAATQKVVMAVAIIGTVVILVTLSITSRDTFVNAWNGFAAKESAVAVDMSAAADSIDITNQEEVNSYVGMELLGRTAAEDIINPQDQSVIVAKGSEITDAAVATIGSLRNDTGLLIQSVSVIPLQYNGFITTMEKVVQYVDGAELAKSWNWFDTLGVMVAGSWLFAYSYCITFIAGEVKRPDKTIILSNLAAIVVPGIFMVWLAIALYRSVGFEFLSATAWADNMGVTGGIPLPWSTHFVGLAAVITQNKVLVFMMALSFMLFNLWWVALSYLAFPRILFAWGMDRMGPKLFTDIDYRWASPVKNHIICFIFGEIGIALYAFLGNPMEGLSVTGMEIVSVFGITAIAAAIFPFSKRAKQIWEASPYRSWNILGIPVVTIGAIVNLIYLGILFYFFLVLPNLEGFVLGSLILYAIVWVLGIAWYFGWKYYNRSTGLDISMTYGELPPD